MGGYLIFRRGIEAHGGFGQSLVMGVLQNPLGIGLRVNPGRSALEIQVPGGLQSRGKLQQSLSERDFFAEYLVVFRVSKSGGSYR